MPTKKRKARKTRKRGGIGPLFRNWRNNRVSNSYRETCKKFVEHFVPENLGKEDLQRYRKAEEKRKSTVTKNGKSPTTKEDIICGLDDEPVVYTNHGPVIKRENASQTMRGNPTDDTPNGSLHYVTEEFREHFKPKPEAKHRSTCRSHAEKAESPEQLQRYEKDKDSQYNEGTDIGQIDSFVRDHYFQNSTLADRACGKEDSTEPMVDSSYGFFYYEDDVNKRVQQHKISENYGKKMKERARYLNSRRTR
jgi:hypothetical protein